MVSGTHLPLERCFEELETWRPHFANALLMVADGCQSDTAPKTATSKWHVVLCSMMLHKSRMEKCLKTLPIRQCGPPAKDWETDGHGLLPHHMLPQPHLPDAHGAPEYHCCSPIADCLLLVAVYSSTCPPPTEVTENSCGAARAETVDELVDCGSAPSPAHRFQSVSGPRCEILVGTHWHLPPSGNRSPCAIHFLQCVLRSVEALTVGSGVALMHPVKNHQLLPCKQLSILTCVAWPDQCFLMHGAASPGSKQIS
jgi:hypothetical protein